MDQYLAVRRALGFKLRGHDRLLADFLDHLERSGTMTLTVSAAVTWATAPGDVSPVRWAQRLSVVRGFARHLQCLDPTVEVPPDDLLTCRRQRQTPYLYSEKDIVRLLRAAATLRPALRAVTHEAFFGLLAVTSMRIGEAIRLDRADVDLDAGVIQIDDTKFRKHRRVPLHDSTVAALRRYSKIRDKLCPAPKAPSFFVSTRDTRLLDVCVHGVFGRLRNPVRGGVPRGSAQRVAFHAAPPDRADHHRQEDARVGDGRPVPVPSRGREPKRVAPAPGRLGHTNIAGLAG